MGSGLEMGKRRRRGKGGRAGLGLVASSLVHVVGYTRQIYPKLGLGLQDRKVDLWQLFIYGHHHHHITYVLSSSDLYWTNLSGF